MESVPLYIYSSNHVQVTLCGIAEVLRIIRIGQVMTQTGP